MSSLLLYLEDAPLGPDVAATGLSKAFNASFSALLPYSAAVCIVQTHESVDPSLFIKEWRTQPAWSAPRVDWVLARVCAKLPWPLARQAAFFHGRYIGWRLRRALRAHLPKGIRLLAPVGVDPLTLVRADSVARYLSANLEPYFVDDIQNHPSNHHRQADLNIALTCLLQRATRIYTITDGLGELMHARHAVRPVTLNLVAASTGAPTHHSRRDCNGAFALFLGSINHLYADGLRLLIDRVSELRQETNLDLTIRISSSPAQVKAELGEVPSWVVVGSIADHAQLHKELAAATFCFLPYSFADRARSMAISSFPSKLIDYLAHANAILVFSPESAVPYRLLQDYELPFFCASPTSLREQLLTLLEERPMLTSHYRRLLDQLFSARAMRLVLGLGDIAE